MGIDLRPWTGLLVRRSAAVYANKCDTYSRTMMLPLRLATDVLVSWWKPEQLHDLRLGGWQVERTQVTAKGKPAVNEVSPPM